MEHLRLNFFWAQYFVSHKGLGDFFYALLMHNSYENMKLVMQIKIGANFLSS